VMCLTLRMMPSGAALNTQHQPGEAVVRITHFLVERLEAQL